MSLAARFNKIFEKELAPYGYVKLKGMNCFAKLINNEIIHYITFKSVPSMVKGKKAFSICADIQTIYSSNLSKSYIKYFSLDIRNFGWLDESIEKMTRENYYWNTFHYDLMSLDSVLIEASKVTINIAKKCMENVKDLKSYVDFCKNSYYLLIRLSKADELNLDSMLLIKTDNHESFDDIYQKYMKYENRSDMKEQISIFKHNLDEGIIKPRDRVYNSPELLQKTNEELERRKRENTIVLASYGINIENLN